MINRNDIVVAVAKDGTMYVAQGGPATTALESRDEIVSCEKDLYYSQLRHRSVRLRGGQWEVCYASESSQPTFDLGRRRATGSPIIIGFSKKPPRVFSGDASRQRAEIYAEDTDLEVVPAKELTPEEWHSFGSEDLCRVNGVMVDYAVVRRGGVK